jgi:hypothetical protein
MYILSKDEGMDNELKVMLKGTTVAHIAARRGGC